MVLIMSTQLVVQDEGSKMEKDKAFCSPRDHRAARKRRLVLGRKQ